MEQLLKDEACSKQYLAGLNSVDECLHLLNLRRLIAAKSE